MKIADHNARAILFSLALIFIVTTAGLIGVIKNNYFYSKQHKKASNQSLLPRNVAIRVDSSDNYLGMYIRGESTVSISGSLVTRDGEPVSNTEIDVYLNISETKSIFIGTYQTDDTGAFSISFLLPLNVPEGNRTITIRSKPDPWSGIGSATAYYWLYVFSRVHVMLELERNEAALFEKNISFSVYAYFDNGTIVRRENMLFTVNITHDSYLENVTLKSNSDGVAGGLINFTLPGLYTIKAIFNTSDPSNFISDFVLADQQDIVSDTVVGDTLSSDIADLSVYLADRITISFENTLDKEISVFRNGTLVTVTGRYLNISGYPDQHQLNFSIVYFGEQDDQLLLFINLTIFSNQSGFFSYSFLVNESFYPGKYVFLCDDLNESTLDIFEPLTMLVISNMSLEITSIDPNPNTEVIASGSTIKINGYVLDGVDRHPLENISVKGLMLSSNSGSEIELNETLSGIEGNFSLFITLPPNVESERVTIVLQCSGSDYYLSDEASFVISVYNYLILTMSINSSRYFWFVRNGVAIARNDTSLTGIVFPANLSVKISLTDDFGRAFNVSRIAILVNGSRYLEFQDTSEVLFNLINIESTLNITLILASLGISVSFFIIGQRPSNNVNGGIIPNIPTLAIVIIVLAGPLVIIGLIGEIRLSAEEYEKGEKENVLGIVLNIERAGIEKKFLELATYIRMLFNQLASERGITLSSSLTTREIYNILLEKDSELIDARDHLDFLLYCYEKIIYGFKKLSDEEISRLKSIISDLYIFLKSLTIKREGENG